MRKLNVMIVAGLIVAIIGAAVVIAYGRSVDNKIADGKQTVSVLVAKQDIPAGTSADQLGGMFAPKDVPSAYVESGALSSLTGQSGFLTAAVKKNGQVSSNDFSAQQSSGITGVTPQKGMVSVSIQVNLSPGVAKYVSPNSYVDMFVTYSGATLTNKSNNSSSSLNTAALTPTKLFASNVRVLSVTPATDTTDTTSSSSTAPNQVSPGDQVIAVVEVSPTLAQKIVNATTLGQIYLGLDRKGDVHRTARGSTPVDVLTSNK
jgi:pilus assembly protein CpaB